MTVANHSISPRHSEDRPQSPRRPGRPTLSNDQLLDVALDLFLEHGFERTSVDAITSAAGMAKRTVYARYGDKEMLFRAALRHAIDKWIVPVEHLKELETADLSGTLMGIGDRLVSNIMSPAGLRLFRLTNTVSGRMPEIAAENVQRGTEPTVAFLVDLFGRSGAFAVERAFDAAEAAMAFMHLVVGGPSSMAAWGVRLDQDAIDRHTRSSVDLFLHGLLPREKVSIHLDDENLRLRRLLTDALLENAVLKDLRDTAT